jgi:hypothetical protein
MAALTVRWLHIVSTRERAVLFPFFVIGIVNVLLKISSEVELEISQCQNRSMSIMNQNQNDN